MGGGISNEQSYYLQEQQSINSNNNNNNNNNNNYISKYTSSNYNPNVSNRQKLKNLRENELNNINTNNVDVSVFIIYPEIVQWKEHLYMLKFNDSEIGKLYRIYKKLRVEDSDEVSIDSLLEFCHLSDSIFMKKVFSLIKNPETGNLSNFWDFLLTIWHFCTIGKDLACLIFDLYDEERKRVLDNRVADEMIKEMYGKKFEQSQVALQLLVKMHKQSSKNIPRYYFLEFIYANPVLLQCCGVYRKRITDVILERSIWDRLEQERIILTRGSYYHMNEVQIMTEQYSQQQIIHHQISPHTTHSALETKHTYHLAHKLNNSSTYQNSVRLSSRRQRVTGYTTTDITVGNKVLKPIIQKGEYDESMQIHIKPLPPTKAPERIQKLKYYTYMT